MQIDFAARTHIGHIRSSNQDALECVPELGLFLVADGMGGHADGERAARMAVDGIPQRFRNFSKGGLPAETIEDLARGDEWLRALDAAIRTTSDEIFAAGAVESGHLPMGTTVVALHLDPAGGRARWAHVGDSRLYRLRDAELELLTTDHTRFGRAYEGYRQAPVDLPHTNQLLSAVGISRNLMVAGGDDELRAGDRFLLCSDGISAMVSATGLHAFLSNNDDAETTAERLIDSALRAGGRDNATAIVIQTAD